MMLGQGPAQEYYWVLERSVAPYLYDDLPGQCAWEFMLDLMWRLSILD
jgi:hypothetical protein